MQSTSSKIDYYLEVFRQVLLLNRKGLFGGLFLYLITLGTDLSLSPEGEIRIILSEQRHRQIASLSLPVTDVTFQLKNVAESTKKDFFEQFDRAYHRGGG